MIELLLLFPLLIGITCVVAWIGFLLIQKTKIEKHAWVVQTQETYKISNNILEMDPQYRIKNNKSLMNLFNSFQNIRTNLPKNFSGFLLTHTTDSMILVLDKNAPNVIQQFFTAGFNDHKNILPYQLSAEMIIPDSSMENAKLTKHLIWFEAMQKAGFNYELWFLGLPELAGIPTDFIGDFKNINPESQK